MLTILQGDALARLKELPAESVQMCCTSPPYWGLRDYGTASWEGGDAGCDHKGVLIRKGISGGTNQGSKCDNPNGPTYRPLADQYGGECKCGAKRIDSQLGLEKTPEEYVTKTVEVFREVRRVLKNDGVLFLNLGDSYFGSWGNYSGEKRGQGDSQCEINNGSQVPNPAYDGLEKFRPPTAFKIEGLKPKDLVGIPWMMAFALRADGWYLRSDIIWAKPNPMPESVTDRPTKSHEYLFLLTKQARYFYNAAAIRETGKDPEDDLRRISQISTAHKSKPDELRNGLRGTVHRTGRTGMPEYETMSVDGKRNKRSVWTVATAPYPDAHFATYPPDLIKPCILAGSRPGDTVLDPFAGSGTTGMVALELGRKAILIELNPNYIELINQHCNVTAGLALC